MSATDPGREVQLVAGDTTYTLYAGNRALRWIERETGTSMIELFSADGLATLGIGSITTFVCGLLQRHHPGTTVENVDDIFDAAGYDAVLDAMTRALTAAMPSGGDASGKAPAGNGVGTSS
jgi:hypothetical protein